MIISPKTWSFTDGRQLLLSYVKQVHIQKDFLNIFAKLSDDFTVISSVPIPRNAMLFYKIPAPRHHYYLIRGVNLSIFKMKCIASCILCQLPVFPSSNSFLSNRASCHKMERVSQFLKWHSLLVSYFLPPEYES